MVLYDGATFRRALRSRADAVDQQLVSEVVRLTDQVRDLTSGTSGGIRLRSGGELLLKEQQVCPQSRWPPHTERGRKRLSERGDRSLIRTALPWPGELEQCHPLVSHGRRGAGGRVWGGRGSRERGRPARLFRRIGNHRNCSSGA